MTEQLTISEKFNGQLGRAAAVSCFQVARSVGYYLVASRLLSTNAARVGAVFSETMNTVVMLTLTQFFSKVREELKSSDHEGAKRLIIQLSKPSEICMANIQVEAAKTWSDIASEELNSAVKTGIVVGIGVLAGKGGVIAAICAFFAADSLVVSRPVQFLLATQLKGRYDPAAERQKLNQLMTPGPFQTGFAKACVRLFVSEAKLKEFFPDPASAGRENARD